MMLSQELSLIVQSLLLNLPIFLVCFGLLSLAIVRRKNAKEPANYAIAGILLITVIEMMRVMMEPNLPRLVGFFVPGQFLAGALAIANFGLNTLFALGLLILGGAVFMDRQNW